MFDGVVEFGILTAPKGVELPDSVYTMTELQNLDGTVGVSLIGTGESCASSLTDHIALVTGRGLLGK